MKQASDEVDLRSLQRRSLHDDKVTSLKNSGLASPNFLRLVCFIVDPSSLISNFFLGDLAKFREFARPMVQPANQKDRVNIIRRT